MNDKYELDPGRRAVVAGLGAAAATALIGSMTGSALAQTAAPVGGRRMLGEMEVTPIGMGVQNMHRSMQTLIPHRPEMIRIIQAAHDQGVGFFDCAEVYGPHECERILGEGTAGFRDEIAITTKFGFNVDLETGEQREGLNSQPEHIRPAVEGSLQRLNTDRIDLLFQHRVDPTVPIEDVAGAVAALMDEGKVLHWGLSEMGLDTLRRAHAALPVAAVQSEYSMLWRGPEEAVLPMCRELGIGFVPFAPLGYGFLAGVIDDVTTFAPGDFRAGTTRMSPENLSHNLRLVELVRAWAERKEAMPSQVALAWLMAQAPWVVPIPGTTQMHHMLQNAGAPSVTFTDDEIAELNGAVRAIEIRGERMPPIVQAWSDVEAPPQS